MVADVVDDVIDGLQAELNTVEFKIGQSNLRFQCRDTGGFYRTMEQKIDLRTLSCTGFNGIVEGGAYSSAVTD